MSDCRKFIVTPLTPTLSRKARGGIYPKILKNFLYGAGGFMRFPSLYGRGLREGFL